MAMVSKLKLTPDASSLLSVSEYEPVLLYRGGEESDVSWCLRTPSGRPFLAFVDYQNVVFKFECFGILLEEKKVDPERSLAVTPPAGEMYSVEFLFRSEWERPAKPNEVPEHYEQVRRRHGPLATIEESATAACVSLVGITWISDPKEPTKQALLIDPDGENPTALVYCQDQEEIAAFVTSCDAVPHKNLREWEGEIGSWLTQ